MSPLREQVVGTLVVELEVFEHGPEAAVRLDVVECVVDDREVAQPQEVHLDEAERLARRVVELRDDLAVLLALHDRDDVDQRIARHDDAGRVHTPLALQVLEPERRLEDRLRLGVGLDEGADVAGLLVTRVVFVDDARQRDVFAHDRGRHRLGELLAHAEREPEHAARVLQGLLRLDRAVGHDLGDALVAVLLGDVLDDLTATTLVEVDVEVGHRDAVGVQEALEDEPVPQRVEVGDAHRVRGHRPGTRATAGTDPDAVVLRPVDEVGDDEEVAGEPHLQDDADLVVGLLAHLGGDAVRVAHCESSIDLFDEPGLFALALGNREARHVVGVGVEAHVAALGDEQRVVAGLGMVAEDVPHLGGGLQVELVGVELEAVRVVERRARLHAQQGGVALGVVRVRVVQVVGADERQVELVREAQQVAHDALLDAESVIHDLGEVVVAAEDVAIVGCRLQGFVVLTEPQARLHLSGGAPGRRDEPVGVLREQLAIHARLEVVALDRRPAREAEQVVHARCRFGQERHVRICTRAGHVVAAARTPAHPGLVTAVRSGRDVRLGADDRLDAGVGRLFPEVIGAEHVAVVGDRDGRHRLVFRRLDELPDPGRAVEHRVLAVHVQVDEGIGGHGAPHSGFDGTSSLGSTAHASPRATARAPARDRPDTRNRRWSTPPCRGA